MSEKSFTITVDLEEFMMEFVPKLVRQYIRSQTPGEDMVGTILTLAVDISGDVYSYSVTDGVVLDVLRGKLDSPMLYLSVPLEAMAVLGKMKYVDILLGMQSRFTRESYDLFCELGGTVIFRMSDPKDNLVRIRVTFNDARTPETVVNLSLEDARRFTAGKTSTETLLAEGKLTLEGDMDFAVSLGRLFS